jgi:hypothetical protein
MARGTWQGSGTWQSSGPDLRGLGGPVALVVVVYVVAEIVLQLIWYIAAFLAAVVVGAVVGAVLLRRKTLQHAAELETTRPARLAAAAARQIAQAAPAAIELHYHSHYHAAPDSPARIVIPGTAGDAITERNTQ